ncbi:hypothetical protein SSPO_001350 [Streptomyces antimycoticus]|uniref:TnsA endonuclease N-terminal domain-containing protein n=1 Tax=Streptomyces antimycoticus TaxID=68175 RepID=A0A499UU68_9ACTN|nr:TnsA-like heteromeric transposase endonuclease subunit [Streptomyces antimycoticus]BBJ37417.1 hypothetical protein SSPO_001350 [Streptomyces antimycoticus]
MGDVVWAQFCSPAGRLIERPASELCRERLEEREPVWKPQRYKGRRAIATWWRLADQVRHAGCATLGALDAALSLEFDTEVATFAGWPMRLRWEGGAEGCVPDFFARLKDGRGRVVVCQPGGREAADRASTRGLLEAAGKQAGWQVRMHTGMGDAVVTRNRQRLSRFRHARLADADTARVLHQVFAQPRPLDDGVAVSGLPRLSTTARAHHLIWRRELLIDWASPFVPARSLVWSPQEAC